MENFKDTLILRDIPKNKITVKDQNGKILFEKTNLVVQRGRLFTLEKIFHQPVTLSDLNQGDDKFVVNNVDRKICFFKIGKGGTLNGPFFPVNPTPNDKDLYDPIPFRVELAPILDAEYILPPTEDDSKYFYYGRGFEATTYDIDIIQDQGNNIDNLISIKIHMKVSHLDARDQEINEIGLYIAELDGTGKVLPDTVELFSRVTFASEIMDGEKILDIVYTVYA